MSHININARASLSINEQSHLRAATSAVGVGGRFTVGRQGSVYTVVRVDDRTLQVTQTQQSRVGTIYNALCGLFGDGLTGSERLARDLEEINKGTTATASRKQLDPFAAAVLLNYDDKQVTNDVNSAMKKIKDGITKDRKSVV